MNVKKAYCSLVGSEGFTAENAKIAETLHLLSILASLCVLCVLGGESS